MRNKDRLEKNYAMKFFLHELFLHPTSTGWSRPSCQATRSNRPRAPVTPWPRADAPWSRLHVDFAGPFKGRHFLVVVDSHTAWADTFVTSGPTTEEAIRCLDATFRYNGLPFTLVSDNGSAFTSHRFRTYCAQRGVKQLFTAPRHPQSNGRAERKVRSVKEALRRLPSGPYQRQLDTVLESANATPGEDGRSRSERLMGRPVRTALSLVGPAPQREVPEPAHSFCPGDAVYYKHHGDPVWRPALVERFLGAQMVAVRTPAGQVERRHQDQLRRRVLGNGPDVQVPVLHDVVLPQVTPTRATPEPGPRQVPQDGPASPPRPRSSSGTSLESPPPGPLDGGTPPRTPVHPPHTDRDRRRSRGRGQAPVNPRGEEILHPGPRSTRNPNPVYKEPEQRFRSALNDWRTARWAAALAKDTETPGHVRQWRRIKVLKKGCDKIPTLEKDGRSYTTDQEKAEVLGAHYEAVHHLTENLGDPEDGARAAASLHLYMCNEPCAPIPPVTVGEVQSIYKRMKTRKAPGADGVHPAALKQLPQCYLEALCAIFQSILDLRHYPACWKEATIKPIPKHGKNLTLPGSHRPISLLSAIGKAAERVIYSRLVAFL
ncbi:hypothetical protein ONE63_008139 [Megalurothrips usitatus]|uniref:Integrase catalytic domain-containing protein n=1 Tax=Megalurothrips usitatus TaxID=439358 RepID=A0AAV7XS31_9NEOP|nr:hypothetical protein ONE63_008139 [Megalurothrips usitatus]